MLVYTNRVVTTAYSSCGWGGRANGPRAHVDLTISSGPVLTLISYSVGLNMSYTLHVIKELFNIMQFVHNCFNLYSLLFCILHHCVQEYHFKVII